MFIFANIYKIPENSKSLHIINMIYDDKNAKKFKKGHDKRETGWYNNKAFREKAASEREPRSLKIEQQEISTKHTTNYLVKTKEVKRTSFTTRE